MKTIASILAGIGMLGSLATLFLWFTMVVFTDSPTPDKSFITLQHISFTCGIIALILGLLGTFIPIFATNKSILVVGQGAGILSGIIAALVLIYIFH